MVAIYEEISENATEQFYEEIPARHYLLTQAPEEVTTPVPPLKAICSFWQGKVEMAVRITILVVSRTCLIEENCPIMSFRMIAIEMYNYVSYRIHMI